MKRKRKVVWIDAGELHAGDILAVDLDDRRIYYHICEVAIVGNNVTLVWNSKDGFDREQCELDDQVRIRVGR